jgi:hypothetical protein
MLLFDLPDLNIFKVGRRTLTPPDPQLKGAWYPGGFNPCTYQVKNRFQNVLFKFNLHRPLHQGEGADRHRGAADDGAGDARLRHQERTGVTQHNTLQQNTTVSLRKKTKNNTRTFVSI